jgi:hypothetical protein
VIVDLALAYLVLIALVVVIMRGAKARNRAERAADAETTDDLTGRTR